ncbi:FkbM family methyltransferase [Cognatiluteimonas profundi]|uniref:FkbM family methyltransferase n=1 Tax=Cognatiluteimonas profundi TaxID=2594501 RepID=UPI0018EF19C4|nr:FkbM family methyltransferase [Lysobacter profundi]
MRKIEKLLRVIARSRYRRAFVRHGVAAGVEHESLLKQISCRTVVDIGANRGQFALVAMEMFPEAQIFSFEPLTKPAETFRRVFADRTAKLFPVAVGPTRSQELIHLSARDDSSSLLPITSAQSALFPGTEEISTQTVEVSPLGLQIKADQIVAPALLKMDVQGFELSALAGCEDLLSRFCYAYIECSFIELYEGQALADEVIRWMAARGFSLDGVYNVSFDLKGRAIQADFFFAVPRPAPVCVNKRANRGQANL